MTDIALNVDVFVNSKWNFNIAGLYQLEKVLEIRPVQISLSIDVFNVANSGTVLQRQGNFGTCRSSACSSITPNTSYNLITQIESPRVVRAGARISF